MHAAHTVSDACPVSGCALLPTRVCVVRGYAPCAGTRRAQLRAVLNYALCMDTRHARLAPCAGAGTRRASCAPTRRARVATRRARRAHRGGAKVKVTVSACPIGGPAAKSTEVYRGLANLAKANELRLEQAEMPLFLEAAECMPAPSVPCRFLGP